MRAEVIVIVSPAFDLAASVLKRQEPVRIEAFVAEAAVERLDERIVGRFSGAREVHHDTVLVSPSIQQNGCELAAIVGLKACRCATLPAQLLNHRNDVVAAQLLVHANRQALTREVVDDRQCTQLAAVE